MFSAQQAENLLLDHILLGHVTTSLYNISFDATVFTKYIYFKKNKN